MRVAIFTETYLPYLSGVTVSTEALARGLGRAGHDVLMVAPRPKRGAEPGSAGAVGPDPTYAWLPSYEPWPWCPAAIGCRSRWPGRGTRAAIAFAPQIVHAQSPFASGLLADEVSRRLRAPLVFPPHAIRRLPPLPRATRRSGDGRAGRPPAPLLGRLCRGRRPILGPGREIGERLGPQGPLVRVIPTGIDLGVIRSLPPIDPRPAAAWPADSRGGHPGQARAGEEPRAAGRGLGSQPPTREDCECC